MSQTAIAIVLALYFAMLIVVAHVTGRQGDNNSFFTGNKRSPWYLVAYGMIGASLSGVTFISIPGAVVSDGFSYMQMVLGYLAGYAVIAFVLIPLYYRLELVSIYTYLHQRFGAFSYRTGASFFLLSRVIGASFRLYLVAMVLDSFVFGPWGIPFWATVAVTIALIWVYSFKGGIKTIVWTDTLQTTFMLASVVVSIVIISRHMDWGLAELLSTLDQTEYSKLFVWEWQKANHFAKHFLAGMFITITMTGLDQDMMQKNLTCRNAKDAAKNVLWTSISLVPVNLLFLSLGAVVYLFAFKQGILVQEPIGDFPLQALDPTTGNLVGIKKDLVFPFLSIHYLGPVAGMVFIIGLVAAAYSSADSALTALTTSFCIDFLGMKPSDTETARRTWAHLGFSTILFIVIVVFRSLHNDSLINLLFVAAGYTYGPLLGLFAVGLLTKAKPFDRWVPVFGIASAVVSFFINNWLIEKYGFKLGFMVLLLNGGIMACLLIASSFIPKRA
ncbi:MAG: sodium:solute symporter [Bacteroidetes bacterium]|jgi:Na+/proline symporter|nr:sodium:solute symporter [Bacteroidota bacterium]